MSSTNHPATEATPRQPTLASLLARQLARQAEDHALGLAAAEVGDVTPYEVGPVQPIDARPAWEAAVAVLPHYSGDGKNPQTPPQWAHLVSAHEPETALPFCVGNFPQLVRNFQALTQANDLAELRPSVGRPVHAPGLAEWALQTAAKFPQALVALGALRLAKQFEAADELVQACQSRVPAQWQSAFDNEVAALAWQRGRFEEARRLWDAMPASVPVLFNRGMAALFCGAPAEARAPLEAAVKELPETNAWHHLGRLYLNLAPVA